MKPPKFYEFRISISYWRKAETKESQVVQGSKFSATGYYAMRLCTWGRWSSNLHCTLHFSPVSIIPPLLHTHSFIYHPRCIMFFSLYFSFPLSVSFHHCFILIFHSHFWRCMIWSFDNNIKCNTFSFLSLCHAHITHTHTHTHTWTNEINLLAAGEWSQNNLNQMKAAVQCLLITPSMWISFFLQPLVAWKWLLSNSLNKNASQYTKMCT